MAYFDDDHLLAVLLEDDQVKKQLVNLAKASSHRAIAIHGACLNTLCINAAKRIAIALLEEPAAFRRAA